MTTSNVLGWREWVSFPDLGLPLIKAKVDTGARTSCLHAFMVETFERDGNLWVKFAIHPDQNSNAEALRCEAPLKDRRAVRDSGGHQEMRYVIETTVSVGKKLHLAEITLTDRDAMKFRALLGRTMLRGIYTVDPGKSYLQGRKKRLKKSQATASDTE